MQDKLTPRQVRAWSLCALSVPAAMALPAMKPLRVMSLMVISLALPGGPLRPLFKLQLSQWEGV